ncbi:MAG TPA: hypothetical protein VLW54_07430 [Candidatus Acidoferrales bacterium]|nr:hypothetical protein [Candidatus Acidoferrales bacterium]
MTFAGLPLARRREAREGLCCLDTARNAARVAHGARAACGLAMTVTLPGSGSQRNCERAGFRVACTRTKFILE